MPEMQFCRGFTATDASTAGRTCRLKGPPLQNIPTFIRKHPNTIHRYQRSYGTSHLAHVDCGNFVFGHSCQSFFELTVQPRAFAFSLAFGNFGFRFGFRCLASRQMATNLKAKLVKSSQLDHGLFTRHLLVKPHGFPLTPSLERERPSPPKLGQLGSFRKIWTNNPLRFIVGEHLQYISKL